MKPKYKLLSVLVMLGMMSPVLSLTVIAETTGTNQPPPPAKLLEAKKALEVKKVELKDAQQNLKTDVKQNKEDIKNEKASTTDALKEKRVEIRGEEMKNRVENTTKMLIANANRLDMIITRIESRVSKINLAGGSTTAITLKISAVKTDMASVRDHITIITALDLSGASSTASTKFEQVKAEAKIVKDLFQSVRQNLEKIINDIKTVEKTVKIKGEDKVNATTTSRESAQ